MERMLHPWGRTGPDPEQLPVADTEESRIAWRKSSASGGGDCVQVAFNGGRVLIRDSKNPDGPVLGVSATAWPTFMTAVRGRDFDP